MGPGAGWPYDLVVFGASGFTGQFVVEEVARAEAGGELRGGLRWAVAGRSREKLRAVLERAAERLGTGHGRGACGAAPWCGARSAPVPRPRPVAAAGGRAGVRGRGGPRVEAGGGGSSRGGKGAAVGDGGLRCAGKAALGAEVGLLLCDVGDAASLAAMARQTRLVLNCVGPVSARARAVLPRPPGGAAAGLRAAGLPARRAGGLPLGCGVSGAARLERGGFLLEENRKCLRVFLAPVSAGVVHEEFSLKYSSVWFKSFPGSTRNCLKSGEEVWVALQCVKWCWGEKQSQKEAHRLLQS